MRMGGMTRLAVFVVGAYVLMGGSAWRAEASLIGITPYSHAGFPDNSQFPDAYSPLPPHAEKWWDPAPDGSILGSTNMCGPTAAKNSAVWLSYQGGPNAKRLRQIKQGGQWVDPTNDSWLIERFAELIGPHQGWTPWETPFPTIFDDAYVEGKRDYFREREVPVSIRLVTMSDNSFDEIVQELTRGQDIELSTTGHWFSVMGVRTDTFDDINDNGIFDGQDQWVDDYNSNRQFDRYLNIRDPWPIGSNDGWKSLEKRADGSFYLEGFAQHLDTYVIECVIPEPSGIVIFIGLAIAVVGWRQRRRKEP
jgi:hypothetical protein